VCGIIRYIFIYNSKMFSMFLLFLQIYIYKKIEKKIETLENLIFETKVKKSENIETFLNYI
jgi:hypothetical protein